jgi:hypothetical protein
MSTLNKFTNISIKPDETKILSPVVIDRLTNNLHNEMYQRLDHYLLEMIGKSVTFTDILEHLQHQDPTAYSKLKCIALD